MLSPSLSLRDLCVACLAFRPDKAAAALTSEKKPVQNPAKTEKNKVA